MSQTPPFIGEGSNQGKGKSGGTFEFKSGIVFKSHLPYEGNVTHVHLIGFHDWPRI